MNFHCVDWNYIWRPILVLFSSLSKNSEELLWEGTLRQDIFLGRGTANSESEGSMSLNLLPIIGLWRWYSTIFFVKISFLASCS